MNLTLVLTGLATFGSIGFYGWCEQSADDCGGSECPVDQDWLSVRVGPSERRTTHTADSDESVDDRGQTLPVAVPALP